MQHRCDRWEHQCQQTDLELIPFCTESIPKQKPPRASALGGFPYLLERDILIGPVFIRQEGVVGPGPGLDGEPGIGQGDSLLDGLPAGEGDEALIALRGAGVVAGGHA